jgi:hypothetical protein
MKKLLILVLLLSVVVLMSCEDKYPVAADSIAHTSVSGCTDCHLNSETLKQVATPLPVDTSSSSGEG